MAHKRTRKDFEADLQKQESPFVHYGTPLPPLDDHSRDDGSYVPVWRQEVTDDRGRKRLHGAFTGGFSAGYFNTVGSKEGWAPSTFVSSRTNRAKDVRNSTQQRPEDFMDEEDIREQEESRQLSANEGFTGFGTADDANLKNTLMDLLRPTEDTIGMKLLNKMGWKQGQGIGPKVRRPVDPEDDSSGFHLFAPDDAPMLSLTKKSNHRGLGASDRDGSISSTTNQPNSIALGSVDAQPDEDEQIGRPGLSFATRSRKSSKTKRGAFGVGILNDTGSDEEDPYSMGPKISYNKTLGGDKKSKKIRPISNTNANPLLKNTPVFVSRKLASISAALRKCHDGRRPLDGFTLADQLDNFSNMSLEDHRYRPPAIPDGWRPSRALSSENTLEQSAYHSTAEVAKASSHSSSTRAALLGESVLPGKSVFDYLTPSAREKLMKATGKMNLPQALGEELPGTSVPASSSSSSQPHPLELQIPPLDSHTAVQALSRLLTGGFTPYADDPDKSNRYKLYLESQANSDTTPPPLAIHDPSTTQSDHIQELREFARAAEVFKPVSGLIASRFTTSSSSSSIKDHGHAPSSSAALLTKPDFSRPKDPAEEAAKMGMFGPLTRLISNFYPSRLLCKRFGVAMPSHAESPQTTESHSGGGTGVDSGTVDATTPDSSATIFRPTEPRHGKDSNIDNRKGISQLAIEGPVTSISVEPSSSVTIDPDKNEALEQEKPGAAVFRAIFGSDDSDED